MKTNPINDLADKFGGVWGEHPDCPVADWQTEVANGDTRNSYWQWVMAELECREDMDSGQDRESYSDDQDRESYSS